MDRDDFERRLLAVVRGYMDQADGSYPEGYEIGDFLVLYEVHERVPETEPLPPWSGGHRAGWYSPHVAFSSTASNWWLDEAMLADALENVREKRRTEREYNRGGPDEDDTE